MLEAIFQHKNIRKMCFTCIIKMFMLWFYIFVFVYDFLGVICLVVLLEPGTVLCCENIDITNLAKGIDSLLILLL